MSDEEQTFIECEKSIRLSVDDWISLMRKCGEFGISIDELLQSFIEDLIDSAYSNGRGVKIFAEQWLYSAYQPDKSLLSWLLTEYIGDVDGFTELLGDIEAGRMDLELYKENPQAYSTEEIEFLKTDMADWEATLLECKSEYRKFNPSADWDEEVKKVYAWGRNVESIKNWKGE